MVFPYLFWDIKVGLSMAIEWEPTYWDEFRAYIRAKDALGLPICTLGLLKRKGEIPEDLKRVTLESLKSAREELDNSRFRTYLSGLLSRTLPSKVTEKLIPNIDVAIRILEGEKPLTENLYEDLTRFFLTAFNKLVKECRPLEEKVLGRARSSTTYYP
jgi:hypothetical protein